MYKGISLNEDEHIEFFDCFHLCRVSVWFHEDTAEWCVEENVGLMNCWTYQSFLHCPVTLDRALVLASDMAKSRKLFPVLYKNGKPV